MPLSLDLTFYQMLENDFQRGESKSLNDESEWLWIEMTNVSNYNWYTVSYKLLLSDSFMYM